MGKIDLNIKLIQAVKQHECLYNMQCLQYKHFQYKERLWTNIGKETCKTGPEAKKKWKYLRDSYRRYKQMVANEDSLRRAYKYAEDLRFLDDFRTSRNSRFITPASDGAEVSTDLSSDDEFQYLAKQSRSFKNTFDDMKEFVEVFVIEDNLKTETFSPDANTNKSPSINDGDSIFLKNDEDGTVSTEERVTEQNLIDGLIDEDKKYDCISDLQSTQYNNLEGLDIRKNDLNLKLIETVKNHECLYNMCSPEYKNFEYKDRLWEKIGKKIGKTGIETEKKWKSIKDNYEKSKQEFNSENGLRKPYKYAEAMGFLDDFPPNQNSKLMTTLSADAEVSTDLSSDNEFQYQPPSKQPKNSFEIAFDDIHAFLEPPSKDENSRTETFNIDTNTNKVSNVNEEILPTQKNNPNLVGTFSTESQMKDKDLKERLIDEIKKYDCIYDVQSSQYKNVRHKKNLWQKIGKRIGLPSAEAKRKWKHIRDGYKRSKQVAISECGFHKPYKYAEALRFLEDFTTDRTMKIIAPADAEASTDLSSYDAFQNQPPEEPAKHSFEHAFGDSQEFLDESAIDENSKNEAFSLDTNTNKACSINEENLTKPHKSNGNADGAVSTEDQMMEKHLNERLIDEVRKFECIYNRQSNQYRNVGHKKRLWHKIGKRVGLTGIDANRKWKSITDSYRKCRLKAFDNVDFVNQYKYADSLQFLDKFDTYRPCTKKVNRLLPEPEVSTDLSSDSDLLQASSTNQAPSAVSPAAETVNSSTITSRLFKLLANKINDANLTSQEKNEIEYTVSSVVYSKLAEYNKNKPKCF